MAAACFLGCIAMEQLLIQLECACVFGRGTWRAIWGCEEAVSRVTRLTEGNSVKWTFPLRWDSHNQVHNLSANFAAKSQFHLRPDANICMERKKTRHIMRRALLQKHVEEATHQTTHRWLLYCCLYRWCSYWPNHYNVSQFYASQIFSSWQVFLFFPVSEQWNTRRFRATNQKKWITPGLKSSLALLKLAWHYLQSRNSRDGEMEDGSALNLPEVQRHLSTQIHSKLFCGAQLSAQPVPQLDFCTALQTALWCVPIIWHSNSSQSNTFTAGTAELCSDPKFLLNNQVLYMRKKSPLIH